jgi:UDP-2-acetamido-2,6-beta-L-arabino-hexul-4-ose reductase
MNLESKVNYLGALTELYDLPNDGRVYMVRVNPFCTRGNHYHKIQHEEFVVVNGEGTINLRKLGTDKIESYRCNGNNMQRISIPPYYVHNIVAGDSQFTLLAWSTIKYDPKNTDTYLEVI